VTAGTITGTTVTAGGSGGTATLDSDGLSITAGTGTRNKVKWDDGGFIYSNSGGMVARSGNYVILSSNG